MIYSIGYQAFQKDPQAPREFIERLRAHNIGTLIDVRSRPYGRCAAFNKDRLEGVLKGSGIHYIWRGDILGGFAPIGDPAIKWLADMANDDANRLNEPVQREICIMCMEADPDKCHRKIEIARRLEESGTNVEHIRT